MNLTPWQRIYMQAATPGHPAHENARLVVYHWTPSRYRAVKGALVRKGAISHDGRPTPEGAQALAK